MEEKEEVRKVQSNFKRVGAEDVHQDQQRPTDRDGSHPQPRRRGLRRRHGQGQQPLLRRGRAVQAGVRLHVRPQPPRRLAGRGQGRGPQLGVRGRRDPAAGDVLARDLRGLQAGLQGVGDGRRRGPRLVRP